ncbi:hypothetical protein HDV00_006788 [Rhizophlyctis rosea]|nr:hypothetical protein HDV00_006788 [Rhizophlyctis rosea]
MGRIAARYGLILESFQCVNGEPMSIADGKLLCESSPKLQSLALIVPYEGQLLHTVATSNRKLKTLGLHFRPSPIGGLQTMPAQFTTPPLGIGAQVAMGVELGPIGDEVPGIVGVTEGIQGTNIDMGIPGNAVDPAGQLPPPHFLTSLQKLFSSGIRLTCIKISGLSIPEGDGSRVLEIIGREAIGLQRLQFTAVRDTGLGEDVIHLDALKSLKYLVVSLTSISPSFLIRIAHSCPHLIEIRAEGTHITDDCVREFAIHCRDLKVLQLALCVRLTINAVVALIQRGSHRLQHVDISYCWPILRFENPLLIFLWLVEDNPDLERLGVMYRPFQFFTSQGIQKLARGFVVGDGTGGVEGGGGGEGDGDRVFEHVVVGSRWLDAGRIRESWGRFREERGRRGWWERVVGLWKGRRVESEDERALAWLNGVGQV